MANAKVIEAKQQEVQVIAEKLRGSVTTVVADYRGLNVSQVTELRKQLREAGIEFQVLKNTLVRRATAEAELSELDHVVRTDGYRFQPGRRSSSCEDFERFCEEK